MLKKHVKQVSWGFVLGLLDPEGWVITGIGLQTSSSWGILANPRARINLNNDFLASMTSHFM